MPAGIQPLGPAVARVYGDGGYAMLRQPLITECSLRDADRWGCTNNSAPGKPKLLDAALYSQLSLQARPNRFPHSEVDFGTFTWAAYGASLIAEFGYGTIATAVQPWDFRRFAQIDNNAASHNTVVIREAYQPWHDSQESRPCGDKNCSVNFSQLSHVDGTVESVMGVAFDCIHMDGSAVYGSTRPSGWFGHMHRFSCSIAGGQYVTCLCIDACALISIHHYRKERRG